MPSLSSGPLKLLFPHHLEGAWGWLLQVLLCLCQAGLCFHGLAAPPPPAPSASREQGLPLSPPSLKVLWAPGLLPASFSPFFPPTGALPPHLSPLHSAPSEHLSTASSSLLQLLPSVSRPSVFFHLSLFYTSLFGVSHFSVSFKSLPQISLSSPFYFSLSFPISVSPIFSPLLSSSLSATSCPPPSLCLVRSIPAQA